MDVHGFGLYVAHDVFRSVGTVEQPAFEQQPQADLHIMQPIEHSHCDPQSVEGAEQVI